MMNLNKGKHYTFEDDQLLSKLYASREYSVSDISKIMERTKESIRARVFKLGIKRPQIKNYQEYAIYKNDHILTIGTLEHCAKFTGLSEKYIRWLANPSVKKIEGKTKKHYSRVQVFKIDMDEHREDELG